ncbi:hypothetical protein MP228_008052 [Amoeboaphelidium protococcarum]|nr:hypothetical protein MP228_008052 [Amoeboaphelidium protococcarum]
MDQLQQLLRAGGMGQDSQGGGSRDDDKLPHTSETILISPLSLLKMLKHSRAGVPMEVMGLMLGEYIDEFTIKVLDVFSMPQSGTTVSVESVDEVYQVKMTDLLQQVGRTESVVGWYHSHPGFGCWLSSVDINTQQSFQQLGDRVVAVVIDPIQSVRGKVVIDGFRLIPPQTLMLGQEPRQSTSNVGHLQKPSVQALIHGLNRHYYSLPIQFRGTAGSTSNGKNRDEAMLMGIGQKEWSAGLRLDDPVKVQTQNIVDVKEITKLAQSYAKSIKEEVELTKEELKHRHVGKKDPKRHLSDVVDSVLSRNITEVLGTMVDTAAF